MNEALLVRGLTKSYGGKKHRYRVHSWNEAGGLRDGASAGSGPERAPA